MRALVLLLAVGLSARAAPAAAQGLLRLRAGSGELGSDSRGSWTSYGDGARSRALDVTSWLAVPLGGALLEPRLLRWQAVIRPELRRTSYTGAPDAIRGSTLLWSGSAQLLGGRAVNLLLEGGRSRNVSEGGFGLRSENRISSLGAGLTVGNSWFPLQLDWRRQSTADSWRSDGAAFEAAFETRTLRLSGSSTKTSVVVERTLQDDRVGPADYRGWNVLLNHGLRWGKGSSIRSTYELVDQTGIFGYRRRDWLERLRLQHSRAISTSWGWRRGLTETRGLGTRLTSLSGEVTVQVVRHLTAGLMATRDRTVYTAGREHATLVRPRLALDLPFARRVRISASGGVGYQWRDLTGAGELTIGVLAERHPVDQSRRFTLNLPDGDPATVVLRREDQSLVYEAGTDYTVSVIGSAVTISVPPGSRIQVGQTVLVDYRARVAGDFEDRATVSDLSATASLGPLQLHHSLNQLDSRLPSGLADARGYGEYRAELTTADLRVGTPLGALVVDAGLHRNRRSRDETRERRIGATLGTSGMSQVQTSLGIFYSWGETNTIAVRTLSGLGSLAWMATRSLRTQLTIEGLKWRDDRGLRDRFLGGRLDVEWRFGQVEATLRGEHQRRVNGSRYDLNRLSIRLLRRF